MNGLRASRAKGGGCGGVPPGQPGDDDLGEKLPEEVGATDVQQCGERRGVADDEHRSAGGGFLEFADGDEVFGKVLGSVVHGDATPAEFAHEFRLGQSGCFGGLAEGDFFGGEKPDGEVQGGSTLGERGFEWRWQSDLHGGAKVAARKAGRNAALHRHETDPGGASIFRQSGRGARCPFIRPLAAGSPCVLLSEP